MGKKAKPRALAPNESIAKSLNLRVSPRKLNLVAQTIRGKRVSNALQQLTFSPKRIALDVKKCLQSAIANAENNQQLDIDRLIVKEAFVGVSIAMRRFHARGRGLAGRRFAHGRHGQPRGRRPSAAGNAARRRPGRRARS